MQVATCIKISLKKKLQNKFNIATLEWNGTADVQLSTKKIGGTHEKKKRISLFSIIKIYCFQKFSIA